MKCTLRKVPQGVVATIDERPKKGNTHYYDTSINELFLNDLDDEDDKHDKWNWSVIASTFGVGKEIYVEYFGWAGLDIIELGSFIEIWNTEKNQYIYFNEQYEYTETDNQVIINL